MDIRQSGNYAKYMATIGWQIESLPQCKIFVRHLPLVSYFSVMKVQRPEKVDIEALRLVAKKHHAIIAKLEPIFEVNLKKDTWPLLPTKTRVIETSLKLADLPKDPRYEIRKAGNLEVELSDDIQLFYKMLEETMKIGKWSVPIRKEVIALWQAFQPNNSQILLIKDLAACLIIWETLQFLKSKNLKILDLEGVYDERFKSHTKNWLGFTNFKRSWPGTEITYPGSHTLSASLLSKLLS